MIAPAGELDRPRVQLNSARCPEAHEFSSGKLATAGFCWGGGTTNFLAPALVVDLQEAVPYDAAADAALAPSIKSPLLIAGNDEPINAMPAAAELAWQRTAAFFKKNVV